MDSFTKSRDLCVGAFLGVQWLRIHLAMQGTPVQSLVLEDFTCLGATKLVGHNYYTQPLEPMPCNKKSCFSERPVRHSWRVAPPLCN